MALIDLNVDYSQALKDSAIDPLPVGNYEVQVDGFDMKATAAGRPMIAWTLSVINNPKYNNRKLFYNCPLPQGSETGGIGFLVALCEAVGKPWSGAGIDPAEYVGLRCIASVKQREYEGVVRADIKKLIPLPAVK